MKETEPVYELAQLDKVKGEISLTKIRHATNQIATLLTLHDCDIIESAGYGHAWIVTEQAVWLTKHGVTAIVPTPVRPPPFDGDTEVKKFAYKAKLKQYNDYKTHSNGAIKMIKYIFEESCFLDLEDQQGQMIGHNPTDIINHIYVNNVTVEDHDDEILAIEEDMRQAYDPSEQPQVYFKKLQTGRTLLVQLLVDCPEKTIIRTAMKQFQKQMDLNDAVDRWKEKPPLEKTWAKFKTFFSKETKKNRNRQGTFRAIGLANAATQQLGETNRENQQVLTANSIEQNNVIEALVAKIAAMDAAAAAPPPPPTPPAQANAATDANAKMMATMMAMMNTMKTGGSTGATGASEAGAGAGAQTGGNRSRNRQIRDNDKNGKRNTRRYNNDNYCWSCGFDISHTSMTCQYTNGNTDHKKEATATDTMGGSQRNMHLRTV
jgi:hypothetical protein